MYQDAILHYLRSHGFEHMNLKAVMFDMDGVLFDSMRNHAVAWVKAAEEVGLAMSAEEVYLNEGRTGAGTINLLTERQWGREATPQEIENIYNVKARFFNALPEAEVMDGAAEMLGMVRDSGLQRVLVTGSGQASLLDRLDCFFPGIFCKELMVTAFDVKLGKPFPEPYLMGLTKARLRPYEAIVVENAPLGVQAAVAAGVFTVAVNTGPLSDDVLSRAGADIVLPDVRAFRSFFPRFLAALSSLSH